MLKILAVNQIKELDAYTIVHEPITSVDLMERASSAFVNWFIQYYSPSQPITIVCGTGNNGGDGLAIARLLALMNYNLKVIIVRGGKETDDFNANYARLGKMDVSDYTSSMDIHAAVIIDALFGSGLSRPVQGAYAEVIDKMNNADALRVAVDVPSGLMADGPSAGRIVQAHHTLTFQLPKLAFLMPENQAYVGEWQMADIGLSEQFIQQSETPYYYVTEQSVQRLLKPRLKFAHKGDHGKALLIAGSYGKMGAAVLASRAVLRSGIGLFTAHVPSSGYTIMQTAVPEAMVSIDQHHHYFTSVPSLDSFTAIGIGPGLGQQADTAGALTTVLEAAKPMVIDADALNILGAHRHLLHLVPAGSILTPHPKEFERLVGAWANDFDRLEKQKALARQLRSVVIVKGAHTAIAAPQGQVYFNSTGNPGMATGGSGDVLTGLLTSLLAQKYPALEAAIIGVYLHGAAGDEAARAKTMYAMMASDITEALPAAFRALMLT